MEIKKPVNIFVRAVVTGNEAVQLLSEDDQRKPTLKAMRIELKPKLGVGMPKHIPSDGKIVVYIHDNAKDLWAGVDLGREYDILLQPKPTEAEEQAGAQLKKAAKELKAEAPAKEPVAK